MSMERSVYIAAMLDLLVKLERNPSIPLPYEGADSKMLMFTWSKLEYRAAIEALGEGTEREEEVNGHGSLVFTSESLLKVEIHYFLPWTSARPETVLTVDDAPF